MQRKHQKNYMTDTRKKILAAVLENQPALVPLPDLALHFNEGEDPVQQFADILTGIGGSVFLVNDVPSIKTLVRKRFDNSKRIATTIPDLSDTADLVSPQADPHSFHDIELMIMRAHFAVAENGAVWITEGLMEQRILAFIPQHLAVVIDAKNILPTMQHAYSRIGAERYRFGSFISGPSKTADIEQALILGAHGPRTMTAFIITDEHSITGENSHKIITS